MGTGSGSAAGPYVLVSPERRWRAAAVAVLAAVALGAGLSVPNPAPFLATVAAGGLATVSWRIGRTRLEVGAEGLADRRLVRVRRFSWDDVRDVRVGRPGWLWGGYCVQVVSPDGRVADLLSTRAYSLVPSGRHYDELHRMAWTVEALRPA